MHLCSCKHMCSVSCVSRSISLHMFMPLVVYMYACLGVCMVQEEGESVHMCEGVHVCVPLVRKCVEHLYACVCMHISVHIYVCKRVCANGACA